MFRSPDLRRISGRTMSPAEFARLDIQPQRSTEAVSRQPSILSKRYSKNDLVKMAIRAFAGLPVKR